jgi:hypothetical protein
MGCCVLNLIWSELGSVFARGRSFVLTTMPVCRAFGGSIVRKSLVALDEVEKGLNLVFTSLIYRVIMAIAVDEEDLYR